MLWLQLLRGSKMVYNEMRGAPAVALAAGQRIYQGTEVAGPLFCVVYAPFTYWLYAPMVWFREPQSALLMGSSTALAFYISPLICILLRFRKEPRRLPASAAAMALLFFAFTLSSPALAYSSTYLHADGPMLGLAGLATLVLYFRHESMGWIPPLGCALLTVLAVGTKQTAIPMMLGVPVIAWYLGNGRFSIRYLMGVMIFGLAGAGGIVLLVQHPSDVALNIWILTRAEFQWIKVPVTLHVLHTTLLPLLFTGMAMTVAALAVPSRVPWREFRALLIFPAMALALLPGSLLGMFLAKGDQNALSPFVYFALLSVLMLVYGSVARGFPAANYWTAAALTAAGLLVPMAMEGLRPAALNEALQPGKSQIAFAYARQHPGQVYFPDHPLSQYLAEGRFYHSDWGVGNYLEARIPLAADAIWKYTPPRALYVAYPSAAPGYYLLPFLAPHRRLHPISELSGFDVYELER